MVAQPRPLDPCEQFANRLLAHQPSAIAWMESQEVTERTGRKYDQTEGTPKLSDIRTHCNGYATLAIPFTHGGLGSILPFDLDAGGLPLALELIANFTQRGLWAFGTYDRIRDTGYVLVPFDQLVNAERLTKLGYPMALTAATSIAQAEAITEKGKVVASGPGGQIAIEVRTGGAVTRVPMGKHCWTGIYGLLLLPGPDGITQLDIDANPKAALAALMNAWADNPADLLPELPPAPPPARPGTVQFRPQAGGITIDSFNRDNDLLDILGGMITPKPNGQARCKCGNHTNGDKHPSLKIQTAKNPRYGRHILLGFAPGCLFYTDSDQVITAFEAYCRINRYSAKEALAALNGRQRTERRNTAPSPSRPVPACNTPVALAQAEDPAPRASAQGDDRGLQKYIEAHGTTGALFYHLARQKLGSDATYAQVNAVIARQRGKPYSDRHLRRIAAKRNELIAQWNAEQDTPPGLTFCPLPYAMYGTKHDPEIQHVGGGDSSAAESAALPVPVPAPVSTQPDPADKPSGPALGLSVDQAPPPPTCPATAEPELQAVPDQPEPAPAKPPAPQQPPLRRWEPVPLTPAERAHRDRHRRTPAAPTEPATVPSPSPTRRVADPPLDPPPGPGAWFDPSVRADLPARICRDGFEALEQLYEQLAKLDLPNVRPLPAASIASLPEPEPLRRIETNLTAFVAEAVRAYGYKWRPIRAAAAAEFGENYDLTELRRAYDAYEWLELRAELRRMEDRALLNWCKAAANQAQRMAQKPQARYYALRLSIANDERRRRGLAVGDTARSSPRAAPAAPPEQLGLALGSGLDGRREAACAD